MCAASGNACTVVISRQALTCRRCFNCLQRGPRPLTALEIGRSQRGQHGVTHGEGGRFGGLWTLGRTGRNGVSGTACMENPVSVRVRSPGGSLLQSVG